MNFNTTFSENIKKEITTLEFDECCIYSLLSSYLANSMTIILNENGESWEIKSQFRFIINFINNLICSTFDVEKKLSYSEIQKMNNHRMYILTIKGDYPIITEKLKLNEDYYALLNTQCCKRAYVAAAFLSGGSINSLDKKSYHLEIRSYHVDYLRTIQKILQEFNISIALYKRKKNYILYIKKSEQISDFLKLICTYDSFNEFEDLRIQRDFNIQIVRLNNLDMSNMKKSTDAGNEQINMINLIKNLPIYDKQSAKFKLFCETRLKNPGASLNDISLMFKKKHKISVTRTGLNHFVIKLKQISDMIQKQKVI